MIKIYPTEVEGSEDGCKLFTVNLNEPDSYAIELLATVSKDEIHVLFNAIHRSIEILEIER